MDDASILALFRERDERAILELKNKFEHLCFYVAGNILSSREDAEECVNWAYHEIWRRIPPEEPTDLKTYLSRIVRNTAIDRLRYNSAAKRNADFTVSLEELSDCIPAKTEVPDTELAGEISRFLRGEKEIRRKVFVCRYFYGEPIAKIARDFGLNEKTVATYLFRTRKALKSFLEKEGYFDE